MSGMVHFFFLKFNASVLFPLITAADCRGKSTSAKSRRGLAALVLATGPSSRDRAAGKTGELPLQFLMATRNTGEGFLMLTGSDKYLCDLTASLATVFVNGHLCS